VPKKHVSPAVPKDAIPQDAVPLKLTPTEHKLLLGLLPEKNAALKKLLGDVPAGKSFVLAKTELEDLLECVESATVDHFDDVKTLRKLDSIYDKIDDVLGDDLDEPFDGEGVDPEEVQQLLESIISITAFFNATEGIAELDDFKNEVIVGFTMWSDERDLLLSMPHVTREAKAFLRTKPAYFNMYDGFGILTALLMNLPTMSEAQAASVYTLMENLIEGMLVKLDQFASQLPAHPSHRKPKSTGELYQFKITLNYTEPPIWRRIQVPDCTLHQLHEHIQSAMGWENYHLYEFNVKGDRYGDPDTMNDDFMDMECADATTSMLSDILPDKGKKFAFKYTYDFGDDWNHIIQFEGRPAPEPKAKYPLCVEGERACPPEDVGGVPGYYYCLEALADPKHEAHAEMKEWIGRFDPEKFDAKRVTKAMRKGIGSCY
jgi:hypothetical protein